MNFHVHDHRDQNNNNNLLELGAHLLHNLLDQRIGNSQPWNAPQPCYQPNDVEFTNVYAPAGPQYYHPQFTPSFNGDNYYNPMPAPVAPYADGRIMGANPQGMPNDGQQQTWQGMEARTFSDHRGGEFTMDHGRITQMRDDAGRTFGFGYDQATRQLNFVHNEDGDWDRGSGHDSRVWTKRGTNGAVTWTGEVNTGIVKDAHGREQPSYSFDDGQTKYTYTMDGVKSEQSHNNGQPWQQISTDAHGVTTTEDYRTHFTKRQDGHGHIMGMTMDEGPNHSVKFGFDQNGHCNNVVNGSESWENYHGDWWKHQYMDPKNHQMVTQRSEGQMSVNMDQGSYSFDNQNGHNTTWNSDASQSDSFQGDTTMTWPDRTTTGYDNNGNEFPCDPINGNVRYDVHNGVTVRAHVNLQGAHLDNGGNMRMDPQAPINAFERGHCVYSSGDKDHSDSALLPEDWDTIKNLESQGKNIVVVQTADGRYDIYSGLGRAVPTVGQWLEKNTIIGQADDSGVVNFGVRRQCVSGEVVPVSGS
jgi:hypothetical protein